MLIDRNRKKAELYPSYSAECEEIHTNGLTLDLLYRIIRKHRGNAMYNRGLYERYSNLSESVPIMVREPRFPQPHPINNRLNNDFFSEIVDFKAGYVAGKPWVYSYSSGREAEEVTGGKSAVEDACKIVTDFTTRNNMYGVDMQVTKYASIYGYAGRLFYIDTDGKERVMAVQGFETIILSRTDISEPEYAIRYFYNTDISGHRIWTVEFYDNQYVTTYKGSLTKLAETSHILHCFDYCPLQGIANNAEKMGDAEKVLTLIDSYNKVLSDNSNECEEFAHSYMIFDNLVISDEDIEKGQRAGSFKFMHPGTQDGKVYFLTKDVNDTFSENHLKRLEDNIRELSSTPNLNDDSFGSASGISLKFKLHGLETKCGMFQSQMMNAAQYMWKVLCSAWQKRRNNVDPLQITIEFQRNFPLDELSEAQTVQALISAGIPKQIAFSRLSCVDDINYVMDLIEQEENGIIPLDDVDIGDAE